MNASGVGLLNYWLVNPSEVQVIQLQSLIIWYVH